MTAVLVYGRLNKAKEHFKNITDTLGEVDYFASSDNSPQECLEDFVNLYKPILYTNDPIVHSYKLDHYPSIPYETHLDNMVRHFINKKRVFELMKQSGKKYNVIISLRIDTVITQPFDLIVMPRHIYIPIGNDHREGINDQIALGDELAMEKYMNIVDTMIHLLDTGLSFPHPERLTFVNLCFHQIAIVRFTLEYHLNR
jgi:hypothetical protein